MAREVLKNARQEAGMTQQQVADRLNINLRYYQKIEAGESTGSFEIWDALEDMLKIHQRKLREISGNYRAQEENQLVRLKSQQEQLENKQGVRYGRFHIFDKNGERYRQHQQFLVTYIPLIYGLRVIYLET